MGYDVEKSDDQWREELSVDEYAVLRGAATERAWTGELLDEAARFADERPPEIDTETLQRTLDPEEFIKSHNNIGGTAPEEANRMLVARRKELEDVRQRQRQRKAKLEKAEALLNKEIEAIVGS